MHSWSLLTGPAGPPPTSGTDGTQSFTFSAGGIAATMPHS